MLKGLISTVNDRISFLEMLLEELVNELCTAPPGKIKAVRNKGVVQCYHRISPSEKTGRYIRSSQKKLMQALIHKRLFTQMLNAEPPCISCPPGFGIWSSSSDAIHTEA